MPPRRRATNDSELRLDLRIPKDVYPNFYQWARDTPRAASIVRVAIERALSQGALVGSDLGGPALAHAVTPAHAEMATQPEEAPGAEQSAISQRQAIEQITSRLLGNTQE